MGNKMAEGLNIYMIYRNSLPDDKRYEEFYYYY